MPNFLEFLKLSFPVRITNKNVNGWLMTISARSYRHCLKMYSTHMVKGYVSSVTWNKESKTLNCIITASPYVKENKVANIDIINALQAAPHA